nr:LysM domain-containing protein [Lysinibacillus timonensis]
MFVRTHVVQKGDTLWKIAKQYGVSFDELKRLNGHLGNHDYILQGMEIILPDNASEGTLTGPTTGPMNSKERLTAPITPSPAPVAPVEDVVPSVEAPPTKEQLTQPLPEYVMPQPEPIPAPQPMPQPQIQPEIMPEFNFSPKIQLTQPQPQPQPMPMPMPMPQPQPIIMQMPQQPQPMPQPQPIMIEFPKQEVKVEVEETEIGKTEYVPVPQPYLVYVPYVVEHMIHAQPPCSCQKRHHHKPCGCRGNQPMQMERPCGCGAQMPMQMPMQMQMQMEPMQMPIESMPMQMPCGCSGSNSYDHMMMPYDSDYIPQYFEPNYDIAPVMEDYDPDKDSTLPDWLVDSSSSPNEMGLGYGKVHGEHVQDNYPQDHAKNVTDYYHPAKAMDDGQYPPQHFYGNYEEDPSMAYGEHQAMPEQVMPYHMMHQNMPYQMLPQHMMYPSYPSYPYMNTNPTNIKPWNY